MPDSLVGNFRVGKEIGRGSFAVVFKGHHVVSCAPCTPNSLPSFTPEFLPEILCIFRGTRENPTLMCLQLWLPFEMQTDESSSFHFGASYSVLSRACLKRWSWMS